MSFIRLRVSCVNGILLFLTINTGLTPLPESVDILITLSLIFHDIDV